MSEVREHDVVAAGRKPYRAVRGDFDSARDLAHLHDAVRRLRLMDLDGGEIGRGSGQPVSRSAVVEDGGVGAGDLGAFRRRARPRLFNDDVAGLEFLRRRGRGDEGKSQRKGEKRREFSLSVLSSHGFTVNSNVP